MYTNAFNSLNLSNGLRQLVWLILILWLLGAAGLGWLVKSLLLLVGLLLLLPIVGLIGLQWWLRKNIVEGSCPVCQQELRALNGSQLACPSCGTALQVQERQVMRVAQPGVIDVEAVEVNAAVVDE